MIQVIWKQIIDSHNLKFVVQIDTNKNLTARKQESESRNRSFHFTLTGIEITSTVDVIHMSNSVEKPLLQSC